MINSFWCHIDKLKLCYTATESVVSELIKIETYEERDGYKLIRFDSDRENIHNFAINILWDDKEEGGLKYWRFGTLTVGDNFKDKSKNYVWVSVENRMFYEMFSLNASLQVLVSTITADLGLQFHNFTTLDIAIDTDKKGIVKRVKKHLKKFVPIVCGRAYQNPNEVIDKLIFISSYSRNGEVSTSVYVEAENATLCCYDKTKELKEKSNKEYIDYGGKSVERIEIRLNNKAIKEYLNHSNITVEDLYHLICFGEDEATLLKMFNYYSFRLMRFRDDKKKIYSILDLPR